MFVIRPPAWAVSTPISRVASSILFFIISFLVDDLGAKLHFFNELSKEFHIILCNCVTGDTGIANTQPVMLPLNTWQLDRLLTHQFRG